MSCVTIIVSEGRPPAWCRFRRTGAGRAPLAARGQEDALEEAQRFLGGVLAVPLFGRWRGRDLPDVRLLPVRQLSRGLVVEDVSRFRLPGCPQQGLVRVGEVETGKVRGRIGLHPDEIAQDLEAQLLHRETHTVDHVVGPRDPQAPAVGQHSLAVGEPSPVELVHQIRVQGVGPRSPCTRTRAGKAGRAPVQQEVGRASENEVHRGIRQAREQVQAIPDRQAAFI